MADQLGAKAAAREDVAEHSRVDDNRVDDQVDPVGPDDDLFGSADIAVARGDDPDGYGTDRSTATGTAAVPSTNGTASDQGLAVDDSAADQPSFLARLIGRPRGQLRARKVQRIVRRVDPWSVLKVSLLFYFCVWIMVMVSLVLVWGAAMGSGTVESLESFIAEFLAFEEFKFNGDQLFQIFALGGLIAVFVATAATALLAVVFNLIADLTGGIRFTVVEEESARRLVNQ